MSCDSPLLDHIDLNNITGSNSSKGERPIYFASDNIYMKYRWHEKKLKFAENKMTVQFSFTEDFSSLSNPTNQFFACLWMGIHGHGSFPIIIEQTAPGEYELSDIEFNMGGPWELRLYLLSEENPDGLCDSEMEGLSKSSIQAMYEVKLEI